MFGEWNRAYGSNGFLQYQFVGFAEAASGRVQEDHHDIQRSGQLLCPQRAQARRGNQASLSFRSRAGKSNT
ncbi:unnamed protein product, partial [Mesorhabditis spiculigera]